MVHRRAAAPGDRHRDPARAGPAARPGRATSRSVAAIASVVGLVGPGQVDVGHRVRSGQSGHPLQRRGQLGEVRGRRDQPEALAVAVVLGDEERLPADLDGSRVARAAVAVVAAAEHLEHRPVVGARPADALAEQPDQRLGRGDHRRRSARRGRARPGAGRGSAGGCARPRTPRRGCGAAAAGRTSGTRCCGPGRRPTGNRSWVATIRCSSARPTSSRSPSAGGGSVSHCCSNVTITATSADARCWARKIRNTASSSAGVRSKSCDAVVGQHPGEPVAEGLRQPGPLDVEALQVRVEVLAGAVHPGVGPGLLAGRPVAAQLGQVGEHLQQLDLGRRADGRRARPARPGSWPAPGARRGDRRRSRAAGCAGPRGRARPGLGRTGRSARAAGPGRRPRSARASAGASSSPIGSSRSSGAPVSTWLPTETRHSRSRALNGARSTVSIFMLSSTSTGAPASTSSPTSSGVATTSAGAGERRTPPSSRLTRCVTPSTSTRWIGPCVSVTSRNRRPLTSDPAGVLGRTARARRPQWTTSARCRRGTGAARSARRVTR